MVSVVVPVYNGAEMLGEQLSALARQDYSGDWECVIADNGSSDGSREVAKGFAAVVPLRVADASARRGNAAARNQGAEQARGDLLLFCDQDDVVSANWISAHVQALNEADLTVGPFDMAMDVTSGPRERVRAPMSGSYGYLPYGLSSNMGVRRGVFEALGGFLEQYPAACDVDISWRAQLAGFRLAAAQEAVVLKQRRTDTRGVWRQHFVFGLDDVRLYRNFAEHGMSRDWKLAVKSYGWILLHSPEALLVQRQRLRWAGVAAQRAGRLVGSVRMGRLYL